MGKKDAGFVDQHIEKVALGTCALLLVGVAWFAFLSGRFSIDDQDPGKLCAEVQTTAERTARAYKQARLQENASPKDKTGGDAIAQLDKWFGPSAEGLTEIARIESPVSRTQPFPPTFLSAIETSAEDRHDLAEMVKPRIPIVIAGHDDLLVKTEPIELETYESLPPFSREDASPRHWVSVAAQVDLMQQDVNFLSEKYPAGSYLSVVAVRLQRLDLNELERGWQNIDAFLPFKPVDTSKFYNADSGSLKMDELPNYRPLLDSKQEQIARGQLPGRRLATPGIPFFPDPPTKADEPNRLAKKWTQLARKALEGKKPFARGGDRDAALLFLRAVKALKGARPKDLAPAAKMLKSLLKSKGFRKGPKSRRSFAKKPVRPANRLMPIVAHDLTAEPGHTYQYRIGYTVYNAFAGNRSELRTPSDAERLTVASPWSTSSRPVEIQGDTHFFVTKQDKKKRNVTVTVFKKARGGLWRSAKFKVHVGDTIGGKAAKGPSKGTDFSTDAICLDIDFKRADGKRSTVAMVFVHKSDGVLRERLLVRGKNDPLYQKLSGRKTARK